MVRRPAGVIGLRASNSYPLQIKRLYEGINGTDWIVLVDLILQLLRKQHALRPVSPRDKSAHQRPHQCAMPYDYEGRG